ncbi:MerR family transcriptional regulator [Brevibacterium sp. GP-SGM9]|uniref:MerR family transcriptional regulator n=1 Tax=Brevibacterium sp. GP-SGM9 TaxID=3376990 RepID=UPI0039A71138
MTNADEPNSPHYSTSRLAAITGYSVQQVRDLEHLGVLPPAARQPNGYRQFNTVHVTALRAYRRLAAAVGPVIARATMSEMPALPHDEAIARIVGLHTDLVHARNQTLAALRALESIVDESATEAAPAPEDSMSITELSAALGVRSSTLRFWEQEGLVTPERPHGLTARRYPPRAITEARIVVALRAGGYRIPAVRTVMETLQTMPGTKDAHEILRGRLGAIAKQSEALLLAGTDLVELLRQSTTENTQPDTG